MPDTEILMAVCGGVAAYKTAALVSQLVQEGYGVSAVMSKSAMNFLGPHTLTALTGRPVVSDLFDSAYPLGAHIQLARRCDILCVAPATANFIGKAANGMSDDLLSTLYLCCTAPVVIAPAMNCEMWDKAAVQRNVKILQNDGVQIVGPGQGWLSCRTQGMGRMAEPSEIYDAIATIVNPRR